MNTLALLALLAAAPSPDLGKNWKVDDAHGPTKTVSFTTDEGTWIHLDVHPDGSKIVFSLLGDLYVMPIGGGEAKRITSGQAYDVQPRFSPDGKWIAFASDRAGLEAIWVCDLEGKKARQVSAEKESTVSAPSWSPDGDWIVGRKRLTDTSTLGTVELWMWHVRGGQGVQITKKDEQPDAADPAFSNDGRFLYFSARDARYRYDRDPNEGIWQIKRWDRHSGQSLPITGEFGGAATPELSPDGKSIAFVRRVRSKTRIEVMDLVTGKTRLLADGLQRDNMEGFSFHGVFPGYSWTPDGKAIVATAEGKIWRFDAATGARTPVPFTAKVEQRVSDALRKKIPLASEKVRARILRWPVESPDGKRLVFSALGHLYAMDLSAGTPHRVTKAADLEFAPAFSPDGKQLAFVTWNDREGGHVWRVPLNPQGGGEAVQLTRTPSQYANPSFSRDGKKIVFLKSSGAAFRDNDLSDELWHEIHWIDVAGGESHYVIGTQNRGSNRRMPRPTFSADGERIFFIDIEEGKPTEVPKTVLVSVKLDGTDRRTHLRFARAEEAMVSPDGAWVAFNELHNAYVVPMPEAGAAPIDVALEDGPLPVAQLTDEGGEWVAWSGHHVTWIFGPSYRRIDVEKALPFPEPKKEEPADAKKKKDEAAPKKKMPEAEKVEIVLEVPRAKPEGTVAYVNARVVTMKGDEVLERATIVVKGDRIEAVGKVEPPKGAKVVDLAGKTVIPGLFDEHAHLHYSTLDIFPQRPWKYEANLAYGITSTHDVSASTQEALGQGEMVEAGLMNGPRIFSTGFILYGADNPGRALIKSLDDARKHLRRMKALGAFSVKSYMQPKREQRQWIIQAAREEGMLVVPEGGGDLEMDMTMVLDGHTTIEHALPIQLRKDVIALMSKTGTAYTPTLLVAYGGFAGDNYFLQHDEIWKDERLLRHVPQGVVDGRGRVRKLMVTDPADWHHLTVAQGAKKLSDAGTWVNLGAHGQMQGAGPHWELRAFVQGGMTPLEALRVATLNPARTLGMDGDLGSIEKGKLADFVVLDANPLEKIENSTSVSLVVKNGRPYDPKELARPIAGR